MKIIITPDIARAIGQDAANRNMASAGRTVWNEEDYNLAVAEMNRLDPRLESESGEDDGK